MSVHGSWFRPYALLYSLQMAMLNRGVVSAIYALVRLQGRNSHGHARASFTS